MPAIRRVTSPDVDGPSDGSFSNCLVADGMAYVAGMTARGRGSPHAEGGEYERARAVLGKVRALVEAAGGSMADVVKLTVFVTDIARRDEVWRARREFFTGDFPASTLVEVSALAHPTMKVEVEVVVHLGASEAGSGGS